MEKRIRVLDIIPDEKKSDWRADNDIFVKYISQFDEAFSIEGVRKSKEYYCDHRLKNDKNHKTYEEKLSKTLFGQHAQQDSKLEFLLGHVGKGKSTLVNYLGKYGLPNHLKSVLGKSETANVFYLYINCYKRVTKNESFEDYFIDRFIDTIIENDDLNRKNWQLPNEFALYKEILKNKGFTDITNKELLQLEEKLNTKDIINFLCTYDKIDAIFIAIDNLDETSQEVKDDIFSFSLRLSDLLQKYSNKLSSIVIPLREYSFHQTPIDTEQYFYDVIPRLSEKDIILTKIKHVKDAIDRSFSGKFFRKDAEYTYGYEKHISSKIVDLSPSQIFELFIQKIPDDDKRGFLTFMSSISSGNLKILTRNLYNFFHSCKLNLTLLHEFAITPEKSDNYKDLLKKLKNEMYGQPIIFDLLMAIHYPFYDVKTSYVLNVYNLKDSYNPNDYQNSLTIPRLLIYLKNNGEVVFDELLLKFKYYKYSEEYVKCAIDKLLKYCLLDVSQGVSVEHLTSNSKIKLSKGGEYYLDEIIFHPRYIMYCSEDTPMPKDFIVHIENKYKKKTSYGKKEEQEKSIINFINFISEEEKLEHQKINSEIDDFKREFYLSNQSISSKIRHVKTLVEG